MKWFIKACFLTGPTEIVNAQGCDKDWYIFVQVAGIDTPTQSHVTSNHYKILGDFKEVLYSNLVKLMY